MRVWLRLALGAPALLALSSGAFGATSPADGLRVALGGELSAAVAPVDRGYFNFTDYSASTLRQARVTLRAELRRGERAALLAEVRSVNATAPVVSALYVRVRPLAGRPWDVQLGRIPPVFGGAARRGYGSGNPLVGLPLGYQYLTTVRPDALPASADELLRWRGGGWRPGYAPGAQSGLPLVHGDLWDTGVQARLGSGETWQFAVALTQGTLGRPRVRDDNSGKQLSARLARRCGYALTLGLSAARGAYLARDAYVPREAQRYSDGEAQRVLGFDVEYARGHLLLRAETLRSAWDAPTVRAQPLGAWALALEGRLRVAPALDVAWRADRLSFDVVAGEHQRAPWDAAVTRLEAGLGLRLRRDVYLKAAYQYNWRAGGYVRDAGFAVTQLAVRF